jgi:hypothetical protein
MIEFIEKQSKEVRDPELKKNSFKKWKDTHLATLHTLNKISLVVDQFIPARTLQLLEKCITQLKSSPEYAISPIITMIEANIFTNTSANKNQF